MDEKFFGRKQYLDHLQKRVNDLTHGYRQNVAILGYELVGKTSLVYKLISGLNDNRIVLAYLEARPETIPEFARRFIGVLLYNFLLNSGIPLKEDLNFLIEKSERYIPQTIMRIKLILSGFEKRKKNNCFGELLHLSEMIHTETGKSVVVVFDEFHNLEGIGLKDLYAEWSKALMTDKNTMYIIVSSMKFKSKAILAKNLSLLFGNFEVLEVEPFDIRSSEEYLEEHIGGVNLDPGLKNFIVHFTGGFPFYLSLISLGLAKSKASLVDILQDLLFESSGILNQKFSSYLKQFMDSGTSQQNLAILYQVASGHNRLKDIAHVLRKSAKDLNLQINILFELDVISRSGDFLSINDRVFGFWLRFVYREKFNSLTFDAKNQKTLFRDYIDGLVREFLLSASKPIVERVAELLRLFADDTIQLERKRLRLDHFREIKPLEFNNSNLKNGLIGRSVESLWIMAFKDNHLTEDDIAEFSKECKRYRHKTQRKIIVTLKDVDSNTRLRALEEKIWMWDINNVNQMFDLFSKPRVIA